jgi:hypothetical protein
MEQEALPTQKHRDSRARDSRALDIKSRERVLVARGVAPQGLYGDRGVGRSGKCESYDGNWVTMAV